MAHSYDFTHGTLRRGVYDGTDTVDAVNPPLPDVRNLERVAVSLPTGTNGTPNNATIEYNTSRITIGSRDWERRPPVVALFHEMAHSYDFTHGTLRRGVYDGTDTVDAVNPPLLALRKIHHV